MGDNGVQSWDCIGLAILVLCCIGLMYLNRKWRDFINKKK